MADAIKQARDALKTLPEDVARPRKIDIVRGVVDDITAWREKGASFSTIAAALQHNGIEINQRTLRQYYRQVCREQGLVAGSPEAGGAARAQASDPGEAETPERPAAERRPAGGHAGVGGDPADEI